MKKTLFETVLNSFAFAEVLDMVVSYKLKEAADMNLELINELANEDLNEAQSEDLADMTKIYHHLMECYEYFKTEEEHEEEKFQQMLDKVSLEASHRESYHDYIKRMYRKSDQENNVLELIGKNFEKNEQGGFTHDE